MKKYLVLSLILVLLALSFFFFSTRGREKVPAGSVELFLHLYSSPAKEEMELLLDEFISFYPDINLDYHLEPYQDLRALRDLRLSSASSEKRAVLSVLFVQDLSLAGESDTPTPWISSAWELYYNTQRLEDTGLSDEEWAILSQQDLDSFSDAMAVYCGPEESLYMLGANFNWPWLAWLQYFQLHETDTMPRTLEPADWTQGISKWQDYRKTGYFNTDFRQRNWAESLLAPSRGEAFFVLSDASIYRTYPPTERSSLASLPLPGLEQIQIGSNVYLSFLNRSDLDPATIAAGDLLMDYLQSEGIRQRYLEKTGILLRPPVQDVRIQEIPSLTQEARSPQVQELYEFLKQTP